MDYRQKQFKAKFESAALHFAVTPDQIVSLKLRDSIASYAEYRQMLEILEHEAGLNWSEVKGDFQGRAYLVSNDDQEVILVEHETGLEILYIAGSIASLIGLVPLILHYWGSGRDFVHRRQAPHPGRVEVRRMNKRGELLEQHSPGFGGPSGFQPNTVNLALACAAESLDADFRELRQEVISLRERIAAIESRLPPLKKEVIRTVPKKRAQK